MLLPFRNNLIVYNSAETAELEKHLLPLHIQQRFFFFYSEKRKTKKCLANAGYLNLSTLYHSSGKKYIKLLVFVNVPKIFLRCRWMPALAK